MAASEIATVIVGATKEFAQNQPSSVREVRFIIFQQQMLQEFHKAVTGAAGAGGARLTGEGWFTFIKRLLSLILGHCGNHFVPRLLFSSLSFI